MKKALLTALIILLVLVIGWHVVFWILGGTLLITASIWSVIVASVVAFCIAILCVFMLTGIGIFLIGFLALLWTLVAIFLFPVIFPILAPLFIILLFIAYYRRKQAPPKSSTDNNPPKP